VACCDRQLPGSTAARTLNPALRHQQWRMLALLCRAAPLLGYYCLCVSFFGMSGSMLVFIGLILMLLWS
jgi:hypothetical protein